VRIEAVEVIEGTGVLRLGVRVNRQRDRAEFTFNPAGCRVTQGTFDFGADAGPELMQVVDYQWGVAGLSPDEHRQLLAMVYASLVIGHNVVLRLPDDRCSVRDGRVVVGARIVN
jgi:hypothetical protein